MYVISDLIPSVRAFMKYPGYTPIRRLLQCIRFLWQSPLLFEYVCKKSYSVFMRCSPDLRKRVIAFVKNGGNKAEAARRFQVSWGSVHTWTSSEDGLSYKKTGPKGPRSLDPEALRCHVKTNDDMTQSERARHFGVSRHCIWYNLRRLGITWGKNRSGTGREAK